MALPATMGRPAVHRHGDASSHSAPVVMSFIGCTAWNSTIGLLATSTAAATPASGEAKPAAPAGYANPDQAAGSHRRHDVDHGWPEPRHHGARGSSE